MITYENLNETISNVKGSVFADLTTKTIQTLKGGKSNPMQGRVEKLSENASILVYSDSEKHGYAAMVKHQMLSEDKDPQDFQMKPRAWGVRVENSPFIHHKDKYYLECIFMSPGKVTYLLDGEPIYPENIIGLPEKNEKTETYEKSQGGIEDKIIIRTFDLGSIVSLKLKNEAFNE